MHTAAVESRIRGRGGPSAHAISRALLEGDDVLLSVSPRDCSGTNPWAELRLDRALGSCSRFSQEYSNSVTPDDAMAKVKVVTDGPTVSLALRRRQGESRDRRHDRSDRLPEGVKRCVRIALLLFAACASHVPIHTVAPRPDDVQTIEGIVHAYYEIVNIAPGAPRQWDRDHTLYAPWIHFVAHTPERAIMTHQEFVDRYDAAMAAGFAETELKRTITRYGNVAQVASTYETVVGGHRSRGVNLLQLYFDGSRWWIEGAVWQDETPELPIPASLLP